MTQTSKILKKKTEGADNKILDTSKFIVTWDVNELIKLIFNSRMADTSKNFATKNQVETALDSAKKKERKKNQTFDLRNFIDKNYFENDWLQNYLTF